ncbi:hypothetical protein Drose_21525 [Dactylosporangium roseum]|uniref:Uncharacterized protein n=1 Tax=Dactylosporangium roseum TaxID=47989 RepID=A0ABY5YYX8_9ACTN|nr:hypothetical protein [Dactylosporangium roseum]UWZ33852.1 hypothetical protein Drose_21525 [Dactylosporangium roseum]
MTLTEILPSLRSSLPAHLGAGVWPSTTRWGNGGDLLVGGVCAPAICSPSPVPVPTTTPAPPTSTSSAAPRWSPPTAAASTR